MEDFSAFPEVEAAPPPPEDDFSAFPEAEAGTATLSEKATAIGQGVNTGLARGGPTVAGAIAGAKTGAALGALTGPAAPLAVPALAILGGGAGAWAGYRAGEALADNLSTVKLPGSDQVLTFKDMASVPQKLRPWAIGGEIFGESMSYAAAPYSLIQRSAGGAVQMVFAPNLAGRILNSMVTGAANFPMSFAVSEASMAFGASLGGGIMASVRPGEPLAQMAGEVIGGIANPTRWIWAGARHALNSSAGKILESWNPQGGNDQASKYLHKILTEYGEDPDALIAALRAPDTVLANAQLTAGQKTGSRALQAIENRLSRDSSRFGADARQMGEDALTALRTTLHVLEETGDPRLLREAAQMRAKYFEGLFSARMREAENATLEAAAQINPRDTRSLTTFGTRTAEVMDSALSEVRKVEADLWSQVDRSAPASLDNVMARYDQIKAEQRLPNENLPAVVEGYIRMRKGGDETETQALIRQVFGDGIAGQAEPPKSGELILLRSRMLALSREAAARSEWSDARVYGALAEAALDDLAKVGIDQPAFEAARAWSRQLHQTFSQTFAGDALAVARDGGERIPPEIVMRRALAGGQEDSALRLTQIREAAEMAGQEHFSRALQVQEDALRHAAGRLVQVGDNAGRVNPQALAVWRRDNAELLAQFPHLDRQLVDAETAERFFRNTQSATVRAQRVIQSDAAFSKLVGNEDPALVVNRIIGGNNPSSELGALARFARRSGPDAEEGLRSSVYGWIFDKAARDNGDFSFVAFRDLVFGRVSPTGPPLIDVLVQSGVTSAKEANLLRQVATRAGQIEQALANPEGAEGVISGAEALQALVYRISGAKLAAMLPTGQASSLIVGGAGSKFAMQVLDRMPKNKARDVLMEAVRNPEMAATLLENAPTAAARMKAGLQMQAYLWQAGVGGWEADDGE